LISTIALLAGWAAAGATQPGTLTTLHAVHLLSNDEASKAIPVAFEATVTYFRGYENTLFVQDGDTAIYVRAVTNLKLSPGDRVLVRGTTQRSFRPIVESEDITLLNHGALPSSVHANFDELIRAQTDSKLVTVRAVVNAADLVSSSAAPIRTFYLQMLMDGGLVDATVDSDDKNAVKDLLDAEVEVTGVESGTFDNKMQQTGVLIHVPTLAGIRVLKRGPTSPWSLPATPMDRVLTAYHVRDLTQRIRVEGTITYYEPGTALVLQNGSKSLWITTQTYAPVRLGDWADATGFPDVENGFLTLTRSEVRDTLKWAPIAPKQAAWRELTEGGNGILNRSYDLVSIEGKVIMESREASQDEYVIMTTGGHLFSAIYHHPNALSHLAIPQMKVIPVGSWVRVTGICKLENANPFNGAVPFNILMRDFGDIMVVAQPPWLSLRHLTMIVGLLLGMVIALGMRGWYVERRNRRKIGSLAYLERRRSKILENINHFKPLAEILERITELVSASLNGVPCWCQVADGATLGNRPAQLHSSSLRSVEYTIAARSGPPLGSIFAALAASTKPDAGEKTALAMAAELATLAIEASRLYSDLVHRSEFDILTDVQNRFAMDRTLHAMIQAARQTAGIFGLIYLDLNEFKQVNDLYGHLVGDLYLQEVSRRMKRQLRPGDALARLGGDEFVVLVSEVRNRVEVGEITARLESCFDEPFIGDGYIFHGSASFGIALYPADANSADSLLRAADAAMYVAKHTSKQIRDPHREPDSDS
jgi:diguanylate cyclase (GGDEF)-like protein